MLIASLHAKDADDLQRQAEDALRSGADAVELRLDLLDRDWEAIPSLVRRLPPRRWVATCRPVEEGGAFDGSIMERVALLLSVGTAAEGFIDFEYWDWMRSANIRQKLALAVADRKGFSDANTRLILSCHKLDDYPPPPSAIMEMIRSEHPTAIIKMVSRARGIRDIWETFDAQRTSQGPTVAICLGEAGLMSRILGRKFGAFATYCALRKGSETAPGQPTLSEMLYTYRWRNIHANTKWFGVIGSPVAHSVGPHVFNALFEADGINAVYLPLEVSALSGVLTEFLDDLLARPWLDFAGASVTIPHKEAAFEWLGEQVDAVAARTGAVNTLEIRDGTAWGWNLDYIGFLAAIKDEVGDAHAIMAGRSADVLGAGGAARSVVSALCDCGASVTVFGRTPERARRLADQFGCRAESWDRRHNSKADILVNATPVGMEPHENEMPVEEERLTSGPLVVDLVYRPLKTRLLREAEARGCRTVDGLAVYARQAALQYHLWTGRSVDPGVIRRLAEGFLSD